jgi:hypothetical protein
MVRGTDEYYDNRLHHHYNDPLEKGAFFLNFRQYPIDFLRAEHSREARCKELGITYVPPQLTDSVKVTLERISTLDTAIRKAKKAAAQRLRTKAMTAEDRKVASAKKATYRQKIKMNESEEDATKRRAREAKARKRRRDREFDKDCESKKVPCPPPREDGDTAAMTWAKRKVCRDAAKRLEEEEQDRRRKEKEAYFSEERRRKGRKIWLPSNAKGPGIRTDLSESGSKCAYGREAAAALHSAIKDDMKNGKATVYSNPTGHVGRWDSMQHKRCKGFVHCEEKLLSGALCSSTRRCHNFMGPKTHRFLQVYGHEDWVGEGDLCAEESWVEKKLTGVPKQYHHISGQCMKLP